MSAIFQCIDRIPMVRFLQICAVMHFVLSLVSFVGTYGIHMYDFTVSGDGNADKYWNTIMSFALGLSRATMHVIFYPAILLGLAELIKLMKEKKVEK